MQPDLVDSCCLRKSGVGRAFLGLGRLVSSRLRPEVSTYSGSRTNLAPPLAAAATRSTAVLMLRSLSSLGVELDCCDSHASFLRLEDGGSWLRPLSEGASEPDDAFDKDDKDQGDEESAPTDSAAICGSDLYWTYL